MQIKVAEDADISFHIWELITPWWQNCRIIKECICKSIATVKSIVTYKCTMWHHYCIIFTGTLSKTFSVSPNDSHAFDFISQFCSLGNYNLGVAHFFSLSWLPLALMWPSAMENVPWKIWTSMAKESFTFFRPADGVSLWQQMIP